MALNPPSDPAFFLDNGVTTYAPAGGGVQTVYGTVGGVARVVDLGPDPWLGYAAFEPTVLNLTDGDETYILTIEGSNTADFSGTKQDLIAWPQQALNPQDIVVVNSVYDTVHFRYVRLKITMAGTTPSIRLESFLKRQDEVEEDSLGEALTKLSLLANNIYQANVNFRAWMSGEAGGGPFGDGRYPLSDGMGNTVYVKCPAQIEVDAGSGGGGGGSGIDGVYFFTQLNTVTIPETVKVIKTAGYSSAGGAGIGVGEYTVGPVIPSGDPLPATSRSSINSANRRQVQLIARREINAHALGAGDETGLDAAAALAYDSTQVANKILTAEAGLITITKYKNWENRNIDLWPCVIRAGNNIGATASPALEVNTYVGGDPHVNHEIEYVIKGPIIDIGGQPGANQHMTKRINFVGRRVNQSEDTLAVRIKDDQRAINSYEVKITDHRGDGLELKGDTEKKDILLHCSQVINGYPLCVRSPQTYDAINDRWSATSSPDEIKVRHIHTANNYLYFGMDGVQASITHDCLVESLTPAAGRYAAMVMTRKSEKWQGEVRGCTGRFMWVGTRTDGYTSFGCHMHFDDFTIIQLLNGNVYLANPKNLTGRLVINYSKTNDSGQANPLTDEATVTVGSCRGYCNLTVELRRCTSPAGLDVGDETYPGPVRTGSDGSEEVQDIGLSFDNHTLNVAIEMGSFEGTTVAANTLYAMRLRAGVNSIVNCIDLTGNILIKAGWQRGLINVPAAWVRSGGAVTIDPLASTEMAVHGPMDLSEAVAISWKFKGLKILTINDFDGAGIEYNGSFWVPMSPPYVPAVSLAARGSPHNQPGLKWKAAMRINTGDAWSYFATGPGVTDAWQYHGGTIVPAWLPETTAFEARVISAGGSSFTDAMRLAVDRFFHDLIAAGVYNSANMDTSIMKSVYPMMGPSLYWAKTNLLFNDWPLTIFGAMTHVPKIGLDPPGSPTGVYSEVTGWSSNKHGTEKNNIAIIAGSEELLDSDQSSVANGGPYFTYGTNPSANWRGTMHRLDGGNYTQLLTEDALTAPALDASVPYRIGIHWTPNDTTQNVYMYGGLPRQSTKTLVDDAVPAIYFGRSRTNYLRTSLSFGGIASGAVTNEQAGAILRALNTLRSALKLLP